MIHDINIFMRHPYPDAQIYHDLVDPNEPEGAAIAYVKASEIATFFKISPKRLRSLIAEVWFDVSMDDELYNQFFYYKPKQGEDLLLRYLACDRLLPMVPKRARVKWEVLIAALYSIDTGGEEYQFKDATPEEMATWHEEQDRQYAEWCNTDGKELVQQEKQWYKDHDSDLRMLFNVTQDHILDTTATEVDRHALLAERITA